MNEQTKSLIRHLLTGVGAVLAFLGLGKFTGLTDILTNNLDGVWQAVETVIGFGVALFGFFSNKERFAAKKK